MISGISSIETLNTALSENAKAPEDIETAAKAFESLFVNELLKSMRKANEAIMTDAEDMPMMGDEVRFFYSMFDSQLAQHLSDNGGLGIAQALMSQLDSPK